MDQTLATAFSTAARSTFQEMFSIEAVADAAREGDPNRDHEWDISGLIGFAGEAQGIMAVRLTQSLAAALLAGSGMEGADPRERRELEGGLVGEMTNVIAAKASAAIPGRNVEIAPPVVVRGPNHKISWPNIAPLVTLGFAVPAGRFELDVCVRL
jgi:CheY-specific phosphatase CheX